MELKLAVWDHFERNPRVAPPRQYADKVRLVQEAERLGCTHYQVAEHHLSPLDMAPSPAVFLAAAAQATGTIRLGAGVFCLPLYHPVRLIQDLCMLDNISGGRLDIGVGRGIRAAEHVWFGVPQEEAQPRFDETLELLVSALGSGNLQHEGRFFSFPDLALDLPPVQRPYPPLWYAGGTENAARGGFNFIGRSPTDALKYWELRQEALAANPAGLQVNRHIETPTVALVRHLVVRESYEDAVAVARRAWPVFEEHWYATPVLVNSDGAATRYAESIGQDFDEALKQGRRLVVGTLAMVQEFLSEWAGRLESTPGFTFSPAVQWGDLDADEAIETLSLLSEVVQKVRS